MNSSRCPALEIAQRQAHASHSPYFTGVECAIEMPRPRFDRLVVPIRTYAAEELVRRRCKANRALDQILVIDNVASEAAIEEFLRHAYAGREMN